MKIVRAATGAVLALTWMIGFVAAVGGVANGQNEGDLRLVNEGQAKFSHELVSAIPTVVLNRELQHVQPHNRQNAFEMTLRCAELTWSSDNQKAELATVGMKKSSWKEFRRSDGRSGSCWGMSYSRSNDVCVI